MDDPADKERGKRIASAIATWHSIVLTSKHFQSNIAIQQTHRRNSVCVHAFALILRIFASVFSRAVLVFRFAADSTCSVHPLPWQPSCYKILFLCILYFVPSFRCSPK